jgi:hypothetical protein
VRDVLGERWKLTVARLKPNRRQAFTRFGRVW